MHRYQVDVWLALDESLSPVSMVNIPIDDEDSLQTVFLPCVVRGNGDIAE